MKKIITYGTFDLLHWGHLNLLKRAKDLGDYLIVAISSDEFNALKNKKSFHSFENRKYILEAVRYVDEVIAEENWEQKLSDIDLYDVDLFVMGDDWKGEFDFLKEKCEVVYLERTPGISTTQVKKELASVR
jgi:glycerol-3-phosphate cytidylyltransferase